MNNGDMHNDFLRDPEEYLERLKSLRERNKYAKSWKLSLEKKTNRHTTTNGYLWGWYEIFPLGIRVGFWSDEGGRDDLKDVDITEWNSRAEKLSAQHQIQEMKPEITPREWEYADALLNQLEKEESCQGSTE